MDIPYPAASLTGIIPYWEPQPRAALHWLPVTLAAAAPYDTPKPLGSPLVLAEPRKQQRLAKGAPSWQTEHPLSPIPPQNQGWQEQGWHVTAQHGVKQDPARTLLPSSMMTTSFWAYSWISVSQACVAVELHQGELYPHPSPLSPHPHPTKVLEMTFLGRGNHSSITAVNASSPRYGPSLQVVHVHPKPRFLPPATFHISKENSPSYAAPSQAPRG